jgi:hypothetical protein
VGALDVKVLKGSNKRFLHSWVAGEFRVTLLEDAYTTVEMLERVGILTLDQIAQDKKQTAEQRGLP